MVIEKAYAKINLFLNIIARRSDGYHDIESLMHSVSLHDVIKIEVKKHDTLRINVKTNAPELSDEKNNLVYIAAQKYAARYSVTDEILISLEKNIPIGAGLGGGSSDAAATLRALNKIYKKGSSDELLELAATVGSDVPFCLDGGTAHCLGRGEIIKPIGVKEKMFFALAIGEERISTPKAFCALDNRYVTYPNMSSVCRDMICALSRGQSISDCVYNIFEEITDISSVSKIKENMIQRKAECALMSGSGPSVFGIFKTKADAEAAVKTLSDAGFCAYYSESVASHDINLD